jgi:hypothetical protein
MPTRSQSAAARPNSPQLLDSLDAGHQIAVREFRETFTKVANAKDRVIAFPDPSSNSHRMAATAFSDVLVSGAPDSSSLLLTKIHVE